MSFGDSFTSGGRTYSLIATPNPMESVYTSPTANDGLNSSFKVSQVRSKTRSRSVVRLDWDNVNTTTGLRESASVYIVADRPLQGGLFPASVLETMFGFLTGTFDSVARVKAFSGQV